MKFLKCILLFALLPCMLISCGDTGETEETEEAALTEIECNSSVIGYTYENKILGSVADPFILEHRGTYYLYSTGGTQYTVRTSKDLVNWEKQSEPILRLSDTSWAVKNGWAPEVYKYNGKFYFIFSAQGENGIHSIDIAVCDTPNGRFKPLFSQPFYAPEYSVIDASLFFDDDGRVYFYYSKDNSTNYVNGKRTSQTWGIELEKDLSGTIGEPVLISTPYQDWELKSGSVLWNEGPVVFKENGIYYLFYSSNFYRYGDYSVGYAMSDSPLKMFTKPDKGACVLSRIGDTVTGPGHCNILRSPDGTELYMVYHVHTIAPNSDNGRSLAIDRIIFNADGSLSVDGPSTIRRPLPSGVGGYKHIKDGYTVSASQNTDILFDGMAMAKEDTVFAMNSGEAIEIKLDTLQNMQSVMIYSADSSVYTPETVTVEINGKYVIKDCTSLVHGGELSVATFENLPPETLVESIKIIPKAKEGTKNVVLTEIVMIAR